MPVGPSQEFALPTGFVFGAATSATQIEGTRGSGHRTPSLWDAFASVPGRIADGTSTAVTADHFHRWAQDAQLLADLGVQAYRLSLSWSRIQPHGSGPADPAGLEFYDRLIDRLLTLGITPFVALHHCDMPLEVMERGGWLTRDSADAFADYAGLAADALSDRVLQWVTMVEPLVHMAYGYAVGIDAPGLTLLGAAFSATHHQLLAHGRALQALHARPGVSVGLINHHTAVDPAGPSAANRAAARFYETYHNRQFTDPVLLGTYPAELLAMPGVAGDVIHDGDLALIGAPLDFYGVSYAHPTVVAAAPENSSVPFSLEVPGGALLTAAGWSVDPTGLTRVLADLARRYPLLPPVYVTGIGAAFDDESTTVEPAAAGVRPAADNRRDSDRIAWLDGHLEAIGAAVGQGCDIRGYFHWSLLDSWEWAEGFTRRFGLVRVDPVTLERTPRASFQHYRDLIHEHQGRTSTGPE
jgi:beta-glucosidase